MHVNDHDAAYKEGMLAHLKWFMEQGSKSVHPVNITLKREL